MKDIPSRGTRRKVLALVTVVAIAGALADYFVPTVHLQPLATLCVIAFTILTELPMGILLALAATAVYAAIESGGWWNARGGIDPVNLGLFTLVNLLAVFVADALREGERLAGIVRGRGELEESERRYLSVGEFIPFGTWHTRPDGRLYMSKSFLDLVGMTVEQVQNGGWLERVEPADARRFLDSWARRDQCEGIWESDYRIRGADDRVYTILSRGTRLTGTHGEPLGWVGVSFDITERKRAEERLEFLVEAGRLLALSLDPEATLDRIAALCVPQLADWCAVDIVRDDGSISSVAIKHSDPSTRAWADERGARTVIESEKPLIYSDGMISVLIVPLIARGQTLGAITFAAATSKRRYGTGDLEFAEILCRRVALAYDNARLFAKQQRVAQALQTASLPTSLPDIPGLRVCATYRAALNESTVGGDWYDAFELPNGELALSVGDVAGKGLKAAVAMGAVRQALRAAAFEGAGPAEILNRANRLLCHQGIGMVTAAIGILDVDSGAFSYSTAGHPPIFAIRKGEKARPLSTAGLPLGVMPEYTFNQSGMTLERGSLIVMYTDGLLEYSRNVTAGERAMLAALESEIASPSPNSAESIVHRVLTSEPSDDVATLTVHLSAEAFDNLDVTLPADPASAPTVRRGLRRLCLAAGFSERQTLNVLVAAGEAVSNAIQHAYGVEGGTVSVKGYRDRDHLVVEVADKGRWRSARQDGYGRGIGLMHKLMDSVDVQTSNTGTLVVQRIARG